MRIKVVQSQRNYRIRAKRATTIRNSAIYVLTRNLEIREI